MSSSDKPTEPVELSIGTLSSATGVPVDTLRTWERRYGFPVPTARTEGSHRRYAAETIPQVQLIVRALELGHRPSAVVGRNLGELRRLLGPAAAVAVEPEADRQVLGRWLALAAALDGQGLDGEFRRSLAELAAIPLLERRLGPFLHAVGERWASGALRVSQEHYASERVREFLSAEWRGASEGNRGSRTVVLATLPGERHVLGLHMAAWVVALAGAHVLFLGADTPIDEIAFACEQHAASGVVLSAASGYVGPLAAHLKQLLARLPRAVRVALGGGGSAAGGQPGLILNRFEDLHTWAEQLALTPRKRASARGARH